MGEKNMNEDIEMELETETDADQVSHDEIELEDTEGKGTDKLKALREKLKSCEQEKMGHLEDLQRAKAEFLNTRKRLEERLEVEKDRITSKHIEKLLPLCDSFHMAMHDKEAWNAIDESWRKGVESIHTQLQALLSAEGVTAVDPTGSLFDPNTQEAMGNVPVTDKKQHEHVMTVIQQGYVRKKDDVEKLLRPARVIIGEFSE